MYKRHRGFHWAIIAVLISTTGIFAGGPRVDATPPIESADSDPQDPGATGFLLIDDFESYTEDDDVGNAIWQTWIDVWVGTSPPPREGLACLEYEIVHAGRQAMALDYNNVPPPFRCEVDREWSWTWEMRDWTTSGMDTLVLYLHGRQTNDPEPLYIRIADSARKGFTVVHPDPNVALAAEWIEWRIPLNRLADVNLAKVRSVLIGLGQLENPLPGGSGRIYIDDIRLIKAPPEPIIVDDFESYNDDDIRIYETWIDGWAGNGTGSIVGYYVTDQLPVVHSGRESMRFEYNNVSVPYYSQADRTWSTAQDWTAHDLTHMSLWVKGRPAPLLVKPDGNVVLGILAGYPFGVSRFGYKQATGDCEIIAKVEDLQSNRGVTKVGITIRETQDPDSRYVAVSVTADHGLSFEYRLTRNGNVIENRIDAILSPHWIRLRRAGAAFTAQHSTDGVTWEQVVDAQQKPIVVEIAIEQTVCIGLYMIGRPQQENATAEFSGVTFSGSISEPWEVTDPDWGNSPDRLYVALEDTAGRIGKAVHLTLIHAVDWTQWKIPLSDFTGADLDLTAIRRMYIGVGNRDNPQPNGKGVIYIDDIRLIKP